MPIEMQAAAPVIGAAAVTALSAAAGAGPLPSFLAGAAVVLIVSALARGSRDPDAGAAPGPAAAPAAGGSPAPAAMPAAAVIRSLVDALPTPLLVVSASGRVAHANPAARATLPRVEIGAHVATLIRAPAFVEAVAATLADGTERRIGFTAHPGRERCFEARVAGLPAEGAFGPEASALVQVEDTTEARRAEQLRSDFVANASHELRTPLASIIGYIETLQNHARDDPAARERFLEIMGREAARMQRLVDDLMSLSRIEMSEHRRPEEDCDLAAIAADSASALQPLAAAQGVALEIALGDARPAPVRGDRDQLYQVFANLIDNAIKYAGKGASVRVRRAQPSRAFPNREGVTVEDTGPGIAREHLPRLTERFYRVNIGQSRVKGGTGLGLAIVKHILNRHEGKLEIASTVGAGSAFTVWLPRREPAGGAAPAPEPSRLRSAG